MLDLAAAASKPRVFSFARGHFFFIFLKKSQFSFRRDFLKQQERRVRCFACV